MFDHDKLDVYRLAIECVAPGTVLVVSRGIEASTSEPMNAKLNRIVAMLTRRSLRAESVSVAPTRDGVDYEHEHEHRCAEHE